MRTYLRFLLLFSPTLALLLGGSWYILRHLHDELPPEVAAERGRLVVVVVFDQMRGDFVSRWPGLFDRNGFEQVKRDGVWYSNAHLPYAGSSTGPGHASIGTGAPPSVHGIVENRWYDRRSGAMQYCASSPASRRVPGLVVAVKDPASLSPEQLLVPGIAAHLKTKQGESARIYSLSLKDRAAVLMAGKCPEAGVYCWDTSTGKFHTSSYYRTDLPGWVNDFNRPGHASPADVWFVQSRWDRLLPTERYLGADDASGEGRGMNGMGRAFPHPLKGKLDAPAKGFYDAIETSPFGNELLWDFTKECLEAEGLGQRGTRDLLYLSFSSNDLIGHAWGPDSHEVQDITARSDRLLGEMISYLDAEVGRANYTLIVTADHGVCPLPEQTTTGGRFEPGLDRGQLGEALDHTFGPLGDRPGSPELWIKELQYPDLYFSEALLVTEAKPRAQVERYSAEWLSNRPHVLAAFSKTQLAGPPLADPLARRVQLGWHPNRSGDLVVVQKPYFLPGRVTDTGTSHGTPHPYDTHIPLMALGAGVPRLGEQKQAISSLAVASIVCHALGIDPPPEAEEPLPAEWGK